MSTLHDELRAILAIRSPRARAAALDELRDEFGAPEVDAALAALPAAEAAPATRLAMEAGAGGSIAGSPITSAGGDLRDSALGSGNLVLHDITIAAGGTLAIGALPAALPPDPEALRRALADYLATLLERYRFLSLQGLSAGGTQQLRIEMKAVFINLHTDQRIAGLDVFGDAANRRQAAKRAQSAKQEDAASQPSADLDQWLRELLTDEERTLMLNNRNADGGRREALLQQLQGPRTALELVRHHAALVLLGDPGSGKTTVLRHVAMGFALARLQAERNQPAALDAELAWPGTLPIPMLIQLRRFAADLAAPPADAGPLLRHLEQALASDRHGPFAQHLLGRLETGGVLLMCDGLDEVADDAQRAWAAQAVALFASRFPHSRVVVTSRIHAYRDACMLPPPFLVARLQPMPPDAQDDFIQRWYRAALLHGSGLDAAEQTQAAAAKAYDLIGALGRRARLREIAANPLLLTMMALVHQHRLRLPQQRAELYKECLLLLLEQWEQQRGDGAPAGLAKTLGVPDQTDRLALIQPLAYALQERGREEARTDEVRDWLLRRFLGLARNDVAQAETLIERFLIFLEGRSGLLIARDIKDRYAFPHKTFQEYLAARELIYRGTQTLQHEVLAHRHVATWREVILLVAGHLVASGQPQEAKALGWKLLKADPPDTPAGQRNAMLAGEIVEELGDVLEDDGAYLRRDVIERLVALVEGGHLSARERVDAALILGRLGDPRLPRPAAPSTGAQSRQAHSGTAKMKNSSSRL